MKVNTPHEQYIRSMTDEVKRTWRRMDAIWPETDFAGMVLLVADGQGLRVIRTDGAVEERSLAEFDQRSQLSGRFANFGFTRFRGAHAPWIEIPTDAFDGRSLDREYRSFPRSTFCFSLITHESFHHYGQSGWRDLGFAATRLEKYPQDVEARRRRLEMWFALRNALLEPDRQADQLGAAAWWFQEWKARSPEEVALVLDSDVREATAQYVDEAATVRAAIGSEASASDVDRGYRRLVNQDLVPREVYAGTPDSEAYHAGSIACMLLERFSHPTWQRDAEDGVPPLESLLGTRLGRPQRPAAEIESMLDELVRPRQASIHRSMEELIGQFEDPSGRFLIFEGLPATDGTFNSAGVYRVEDVDGVVFMPAMSGRYPLGDGHVTLRSTPLLTGLPGTIGGLSDVALALPIPDSAILLGGRLAFQTDRIDVDVAVNAIEQDPHGRTFLCVPSALDRAGKRKT